MGLGDDHRKRHGFKMEIVHRNSHIVQFAYVVGERGGYFPYSLPRILYTACHIRFGELRQGNSQDGDGDGDDGGREEVRKRVNL